MTSEPSPVPVVNLEQLPHVPRNVVRMARAYVELRAAGLSFEEIRWLTGDGSDQHGTFNLLSENWREEAHG